MKYPMITAVMVTKGRLPLVKQSYACFKHQIYPNKKLLIVTDGTKKEHETFKKMVSSDREIMVLHVEQQKTLGELRNLSIEYAPSDLSIQWDDDDWYGPSRIMDQFKGLKDYKAVMLTEQLHYFRDTNEVGWTADRSGIEGTLLLDRNTGVSYPLERRGEDTVVKKLLRNKNMLNLVRGGICYCRTYHGSNTWDREHHIKRIKQIGKKHINMDKLKEAAKIYRWKHGWTVLEGQRSPQK